MLASNGGETFLAKHFEALCVKSNIDLVKMDDDKELGEWAGMINKEGFSCIVVKDWGEETPGLAFLKQYLSKKRCDSNSKFKINLDQDNELEFDEFDQDKWTDEKGNSIASNFEENWDQMDTVDEDLANYVKM